VHAEQLVSQLRQASPLISVGILSADLMCLGAQLELMEGAGVRLLHVDVMDGRFCPMMTVGPAFIKAMRTSLLKDVHLMVEEPLDKVESFAAAGADMITVHVESCRHIHRVLQLIGEMTNANDSSRGIVRGVALNPGSSLDAIRPVMDEVEMVLLLAVNPGWKGQKFIPAVGAKLRELVRTVRETGRRMLVGVDGGMTRDNVAEVARLGADVIVAGSAVFDGKAPVENARFLTAAAREAARA